MFSQNYLTKAFNDSKIGKSMDEFAELVPHAKQLVSDLGVTNQSVKSFVDKTDVSTASVLLEIKDLLTHLKKPVSCIEQAAEKGSTKVNEILCHVENLLTSSSVKHRIIKNATSHIVGIGASVVNLLNANDLQGTLNSSLAIMSMLGLESEIAIKIVSRFSSSGNEKSNDAFDDVEEQADFGKIAELLASLAGMAGKDSFLPSVLVSFIKNAGSAVRNVDGCKRMWKLLEEILSELGFDVTERMKQLRVLKDSFDAVRKDAEDIETRFNVSPSDFLSDVHAKRFKQHCIAVENLEKIILSKVGNDLPRSTIMAISALATQIRNQKQKLAMMSASCAVRPCPVGVALVGPSSIGKSMLTETLTNGVKKELKRVNGLKYFGTEFAEDADSWSVWFQNTADQYDQGYASQEIHCVDDAFQDSKDQDHLNYIQKISTTPALTYQASLAEKGMPYRSRLVIVSCNKFPDTSSTIKSIDALTNRFPVFVECELKPGAAPPRRDGAQFDPSFSWLNLRIGRQEVTIDQIIHAICTRLVSNDQLFVQNLTNQQGKAPSYANQFQRPVFNFDTASEGHHSDDEADDEDEDYEERYRNNVVLMEDVEEVETQAGESDSEYEEASDGLHYARTNGLPLKGLNQDLKFYQPYFVAKATSAHKVVAADAVRLEIVRMRDHPCFHETTRNMSYVREDGTKVLMKDLFTGADFENRVLGEMLDDPVYFYANVNNMCCHPKLVSRCDALFKPVVIVEPNATRVKVRGVWHPSVGVTTDTLLDPTFFEKIKSNFTFSAWMSWSNLWKSNSNWFLKLCLVLTSPIARFALAIAKLLGAGEDTLAYISCMYEMLSPTIGCAMMPMLFGILLACLFRCYAHVYLYAKGFTWEQVRTIMDDFTNDDIALYLQDDQQFSLLRKPPATDGRLYVKHNGLALLAGCPMWKWNGSEFVPVKSVRDLLESPKCCTANSVVQEAEARVEQLMKALPKTDMKVSPVDVIVEHIEGSGDQAEREEVKRVARLNKPGKLNVVYEHLEGSADQQEREEVKRVAKLNKPGKLNVVYEDDDDCVKPSGPRFSRTTKLQNKENAAKCKEVASEYLKEHERSDKKLVNVPKKISPVQKSKNSQFSSGKVPEVKDEACVDQNAKNVSMKIARNTFPVRNVDSGVSCFCVVSGNLALFPFHLAKPGDTVEIRDKEKVRILTTAVVRDGVSQWDLSCCDTTFSCSKLDNLFVDDDRFFSACSRAFIQYFPKSGLFGIVTGKYREVMVVRNKGVVTNWHQRLEVTGLDIGGVLSEGGDCGGVLCVINPTAQRKAVAMHTAGSTSGATSYATILTVERWNHFRKPMQLDFEQVAVESVEEPVDVQFQSMDHVIEGIKFAPVSNLNFNMAFLLDDEDSDAQHFCGGSLKYVGDACFVSAPCNEKTSLKIAPFEFPFPDVKKHPSVMTELDPRISSVDSLRKDRFGFPSILMSQIAKYSGPAVDVDCVLLSELVDQLVGYHSTLMSDCDLGVCEDFDSNMWIALNGIPNDAHAKPLAFKASAGIPWSEFGATKKIALLTDASTECEGQTVDGKWFDLSNPTSTLLYDVTREKIELAQQGLRTHSIWKDCLKDELRSDEKISEGKTRAFTAAPFESVLMMRFLFAKYKLAFTKLMFKLNHAVGINPHSSSWSELAALLRTKGSKCLDGDFSSFDGTIPRQFMLAAGDVIIRTIREVSDDGFEKARRVMWDEIVNTIQCSWSTLYMKEHGNNSGQPLTTPTNSIVVFLILWYVFCKCTGNSSLSYFLDNVAVVTFGDDNAQNVKDDVTDVYNPEVICEQIQKFGMLFTSAAKDGSMGWQTLDEIQFLKRKFVTKTESVVLAPLEKESIVQCFNYTLLSSNDIEGWKSTTHEQLLEAGLHGQRFYVEVQTVLLKVVKRLRDTRLRDALVPVCLISYPNACACMLVRGGGVQRMNDD